MKKNASLAGQSPACALNPGSTPRDSDLYGHVQVIATGVPKCDDLKNQRWPFSWANKLRSENHERFELRSEDRKLTPGHKSVTTVPTAHDRVSMSQN
jgi:hypothetical protein